MKNNESSSRRRGVGLFLRRCAVVGLPLIALAGACVYFWCAVQPHFTGDLANLGKIPFPQEYSDEMRVRHILPKAYVNYESGAADSVLSLGDSFSHMGPEGHLNYFAHRMGGKIVNYGVDYYIKGDDAEQIYCDLMNTGFFDAHPEVKVVLLESVGRSAVDRLSRVDIAHTPAEVAPPFISGVSRPDPGVRVKYIDPGIDWLKLISGLSPNPVKKAELAAPLFTVPGRESTLYFLQDDLARQKVTEEELSMVRGKLEAMEGMARKRGIRFFYLVAPDKYEVYEPYIKDNPYPGRRVCAQLSALFDSIDYAFCPLPQLREMLAGGVTDLYKSDDTHWSYKGAQKVGFMMADSVFHGQIPAAI